MLSSRNSAEPHLKQLVEHTIGVCFLGVPHCGSDLASWASIGGKAFSLVKSPNKSLLGTLEPDSETLARIQRDFHSMLRSRPDQGLPPLQITCFFEELRVKGVGEVKSSKRAEDLRLTTFSDCTETFCYSSSIQSHWYPCESHGYDEVF